MLACSDPSQVGLKETVAEQQRWRHGEKYLVLENCAIQARRPTEREARRLGPNPIARGR